MECALRPNGGPCLHPGACDFHLWVAQETFKTAAASVGLPTVHKLIAIMKPSVNASTGLPVVGCRRAGILSLRKSNVTAPGSSKATAGIHRLTKFLRLLKHLGTAPWASMNFDINVRILERLTASHLHLIAPGGDVEAQLHLISPSTPLAGAQNLVWVTNRQQGKTTTLGKFIAALAIASHAGGQLVAVYSTSLDRAQELAKAAKQYIYWLQTPEGACEDYPNVTLEKNNERVFVVNNGTACNHVVARPKNPDSCRGDAPEAAFFDEVGFIDANFWYKFAYPLLQVGNRAFTCATTPPPHDGFFQTFIEQVVKRNKRGDYFFCMVNHSLACSDCLSLGEPERCVHNLNLIPPWKSLVRFNAMKALVPGSRQRDFATEVYGVIAEGSGTYIPTELVEAAKDRELTVVSTEWPIVWVSVDPASHGVSDMGIVAFGITVTGVHVVVGMASVNVNKCQTLEVQQVLAQFLGRIRELPGVGPGTAIVPIIECNNNEILAMSILSVFKRHGPTWMPFTEDRFATYITDGIGVWTMEENKMAGIQATYQAFLDGRVCFAESMAVADMTAYKSRARPTTRDLMIDLLCLQLSNIQDQPNGTVSGKTQSGDNDDLAMAFMMGVFWALSVRAHEMQTGGGRM